MKIHVRNLCIALAVFAVAYQASSAVTFTVTPTAISNTYSGIITLNISGITAGDTVVVQKFLDADSNGIIDSSAILWQQFQITDGQAAVFKNGTTSVTNFNVPCDTDGSANGSITANLYPSMDFAQTILGKYFFKLSSPVGHFSPITNSILVTNFPFAQSISGNVVNNGTNVPDAIVILFPPSNGNGGGPQWGVLANNSGGYKIALAPGTYQLAGVRTNYVANLGSPPTVILNAGATIVTNVPLTNATRSISGQAIDANNSSIPISAYLLPLQTQDGLLAIAFTDTNGNFSAGVTSDEWKVQENEESLLTKGYLAPQGGGSALIDTTAGSVSGVTVALMKETAIFYGTVKSSSGIPLTGAEIQAQDNNSGYQADGVVYTNGNFVTSAIGGTGDQWQVQYDQNGPPNYVYSQAYFSQNGGTNINVGQAILVNFTGLLGTNAISGIVQDSGGNPVASLGVNANATINNVSYSTYTDTDASGKYSLIVGNGDWDISVNCGDGGDGLQDIYTNGNFQCPPGQFINMNSANTNGVDFLIQLAGGDVFGYVVDADGNPIAGVTVYASDNIGDNYTGMTDDTGYYSISVGNNSWTVSVDCGELGALGYQCVADDYVAISDGNAGANFQAQFSTPPTLPIYPFTTLYGFSASNTNAIGIDTNSDGASPFGGGLVLSSNTLYGVAAYGGTNGAGTVFAISTALTKFTVVHTFSAPAYDSLGVLTNSDGGAPDATLVLYSNVLYGTGAYGGTGGNGTVFKMTTNGANVSVLRTFTMGNTNASGLLTNSDGATPNGLFLSGNTLYGTATHGGTNGNGTIFAVTTNGSFSILHVFTALDAATDTTNSDGANPNGGLVLSGNTLYGTAASGGLWGYGTVFAMNTNGANFTVLHSFTAGDDGASPEAGLILSSNTLYGTASFGGAWDGGTVFELNTNGTGFAVMHNFTEGADGGNPYAGLILSSNLLYGTAAYGGASGDGTVFAINTNTLNLVVLYSFTGGDDGSNPQGGLLLSSNTLYGTTPSGGHNGNGTVFAVSLTPLPPAPVSALPGFLNGQFHMTVNGTADQTYTVQVATNLVSPVWIPLLVTNPPSDSFMFKDPNATNKERFYRVLEGP